MSLPEEIETIAESGLAAATDTAAAIGSALTTNPALTLWACGVAMVLLGWIAHRRIRTADTAIAGNSDVDIPVSSLKLARFVGMATGIPVAVGFPAVIVGSRYGPPAVHAATTWALANPAVALWLNSIASLLLGLLAHRQIRLRHQRDELARAAGLKLVRYICIGATVPVITGLPLLTAIQRFGVSIPQSNGFLALAVIGAAAYAHTAWYRLGPKADR